MLTLAQCRLTDPRLVHLSDEELLKIRDELYKIGKIALADFSARQSGSTPSPLVIYPTRNE